MEDSARAMRRIEKDREEVVKAGGGQGGRHLETSLGKDVDPLVEEAVAAHAVAVEARHAVAYLERGVAVDAGSLHPRGLARHVIRHLVLEEHVGAIVSVPDHL